MKEVNFTCISCPIGCELTVRYEGDHDITAVEGNQCKRGEKYAENELRDPRRMVTSTVRTDSVIYPMCSVKTRDPIPKNKIFDVMKEINQVHLKTPVHIGQVVVEKAAGTDIDVVATINVLE